MLTFLKTLTILFSLFVISCSSLEPLDGPVQSFKADMAITVDGKTFDGMAVTVLGKDPKAISIVSPVKQDVLYVHTCGRFHQFRKVDKNWYGGAGKTMNYTYKAIGSELTEACPIYFEAYDLTGALASWGVVAFRDGFNLPAKVDCNGTSWSFSGLSVCQTKNGLEQAIKFNVPIKKFVAEESCGLIQITESSFIFRPEGSCLASFTDGKDTHRLKALGFIRPLIRE